MADNVDCSKIKEKYDLCFSSWYQDYAKDKTAAKKNLSNCNDMLVEYKSCVNQVLSEEYAQTPQGIRQAKYR